jgi:membrane-bound ClpP family serine protease
MKKAYTLIMGLIIVILAATVSVSAQKTQVYYYKIDDNISKPALRLTEKAVKEAEAGK